MSTRASTSTYEQGQYGWDVNVEEDEGGIVYFAAYQVREDGMAPDLINLALPLDVAREVRNDLAKGIAMAEFYLDAAIATVVPSGAPF